MASVTRRIQMVKQPYGGYLPIRNFIKNEYQDEFTLHETENIHASLVGLAVDYLFRYMSGEKAEDAFGISLKGANNIGATRYAYALLKKITGLDNVSIVCACKLSGFDVCYRSGRQGYRPVEDIEPDEATIYNIRVMVERCLRFFEVFGPLEKTCFQFDGGYTRAVDDGDGDYMTKHTIWDLKVSKNTPTSKHTLQLLMYYIMGLHSVYPEFKNIKYLGLFNPRLNFAYTIEVSHISWDVIRSVESEVICYGADEKFEQEEKPGVYTVAEVSEYLGIEKKEIYRLIKSGSIRPQKINNRYMIDEEAIAVLEKHMQRTRVIYLIEFAVIAFFMLYMIVRFLFS